MKNIVSIAIILYSFSFWAQQPAKKDSIYFKFDKVYLNVTNVNIDKYYRFTFKDQKIVTSAFDRVTYDDGFSFVQIDPNHFFIKPLIINDLEVFILNNSNIFQDDSTGYLDGYKILQYFDQFKVFFLVEDFFVLVSPRTVLPE